MLVRTDASTSLRLTTRWHDTRGAGNVNAQVFFLLVCNGGKYTNLPVPLVQNSADIVGTDLGDNTLILSRPVSSASPRTERNGTATQSLYQRAATAAASRRGTIGGEKSPPPRSPLPSACGDVFLHSSASPHPRTTFIGKDACAGRSARETATATVTAVHRSLSPGPPLVLPAGRR